MKYIHSKHPLLFHHPHSCHYSSWPLRTRIEEYANKDISRVTLEDLLELGKKKDLLGCAQYAHHELPVRLARRVKGIRL